MSASLLKAPDFKSIKDQTRISIVDMCEKIAEVDPEFILKVCDFFIFRMCLSL